MPTPAASHNERLRQRLTHRVSTFHPPWLIPASSHPIAASGKAMFKATTMAPE